ncbi:hypothetical protein JTE90_026330 [Oedothorax gibbosus]|uniref:Uncharacterized protein n=1 Tax=Oedothorax gibbosus TaxID=931172 RepID=A0AAV6U5W2_9ARAC|nr:hypothetical protein JTE90_026330 [Oedothorax gibbosus]
MGDADIDAIPVDEFEKDSVDEEKVLVVDDERLESLMLITKFVADLKSWVNQVHAKVKDLENFRLCFTALNLLVVPIVIALFLSYGAGDTITGCEALVMYLMFFSGGIGLPFYVYTAWEYYCHEDQANKGKRALSIPNYRHQSTRAIPHSDDPGIQVLETMASSGQISSNFLSGESPTDILYDFAKLLNNRTIDRERLEPEAGTKPSNRVNECTESGFLKGTNSSRVDTSGHRDLSGAIANENSEIDLPILYEFQIRMKKDSPDLEMKIVSGENENSEPTILKGSHLYEERNKQVLDGNHLELMDIPRICFKKYR